MHGWYSYDIRAQESVIVCRGKGFAEPVNSHAVEYGSCARFLFYDLTLGNWVNIILGL